MATIPLFGMGMYGKSLTASAQRHLNLYAELQPEGEKSRVVFYGTPGTTLRTAALGDTPIRGWIAVGDFVYLVHRGTVYKMNNASTLTVLGTINTTTGRVDMAYDGSVILIVTGTNGYTLTLPSTLAIISDDDFPDAAKTCAWIDGQFVVDDGVSDSFYISPDGAAWDGLDFATAESNPDGLVRVFVDSGQIVLAGEKTLEFWGDSGATDFPFAVVKGATQEFGLAARWSLCKFNSGLAGLFRNGAQGGVIVMFIQGYVPRPLSSPEHASIISSYADVSDATAYAYMLGDHPMLQINFPSAGASWLYDALSGMWSQLEYGLNGNRHRGEMHLEYLNAHLVADYSNGSIYDIDPNAYTDNGTAIAREIIGKHFFNGNDRITLDELYIDMETGVGLTSGQGSDPQVMLSVSKDNGYTYGGERWKSLGAMGKRLSRVVWRGLGMARDWVFKIRITDPVKVVISYVAIRAR